MRERRERESMDMCNWSMEKNSSSGEKQGSSHSWWLDNLHNRPHQSLWLQSTLSDVGTKIKTIVSLIEDDGDTFAKRAEMFYQKRPQLIKSLEDLHRSFCALADKYDQLKSESVRASNLGSSSNSLSQSHTCPQQTAALQVLDPHSDSETSNFNFQAADIDNVEDVLVVEEENESNDIASTNDDYIRRAQMWTNEVSVNASKLLEENLQRQEEMDETVKELCAHIDMLVKQNSTLKWKNTCARSKVEITRTRSRISRVKDSILGKLLR